MLTISVYEYWDIGPSSVVHLPQGHKFTSSVWIWRTDEYVNTFILSEGPALNVWYGKFEDSFLVLTQLVKWGTLKQPYLTTAWFEGTIGYF